MSLHLFRCYRTTSCGISGHFGACGNHCHVWFVQVPLERFGIALLRWANSRPLWINFLFCRGAVFGDHRCRPFCPGRHHGLHQPDDCAPTILSRLAPWLHHWVCLSFTPNRDVNVDHVAFIDHSSVVRSLIRPQNIPRFSGISFSRIILISCHASFHRRLPSLVSSSASFSLRRCIHSVAFELCILMSILDSA